MALDHYVSQVHLRRFYSPALGELLFAIRKSDMGRFTPNAKSICRTDEGNTNEFLTEPRAIEEFLKTVEPRYNEAVDRLRQGDIDDDVIYVIAGFTSYVMTCAPAGMRIFAEPIKESVELSVETLDKTGSIPPTPAELGGKSLSELIQKGAVQIKVDPKYPHAIGASNILQRVAMLGNFPWEVLVNTHTDCPFLTSDYPIAIEETNNPNVKNRIVPLTPELAIRIHPSPFMRGKQPDFDFRHFRLMRREIPRHEAVRINRLLIQGAEDLVLFRDDAPWIEYVVHKNRHFRIEAVSQRIPSPDGTALVSTLMNVPFQRGLSAPGR